MQAGLVPVFVDVNEKDCNINVENIEEKITNNTGAIFVHLFGNAAEMDALMN